MNTFDLDDSHVRRLKHKLQAHVLAQVYWLLNTMLRVVANCLWPRRRPLQAQRVCIYRIGNVGDTICAIPAMAAVRRAYPHAHLTLLTSPGDRGLAGARELLGGADWLDEIRVYYNPDIRTMRGRWNLLKELRQRAFDVWIELPNNRCTLGAALRNLLFARLAGTRWGYGWRINTINWALQAQSEQIVFPTETDRFLGIVRQAGIRADVVSFPLPLNMHHARTVDSLLQQHRVDGASLLAIAPGASRPAKRWPTERFVELARLLVKRGFQVVLVGRRSETGICRQIQQSAGSGITNLAGQTELLETCELLKRCSRAISNDSGVQHLAAAMGTPCISLFPCRDVPGKWWPYGDQNIVLRKWVRCHTCLLDVCPRDNHCLKLIEVSEVMDCIENRQREFGGHSGRQHKACTGTDPPLHGNGRDCVQPSEFSPVTPAEAGSRTGR